MIKTLWSSAEAVDATGGELVNGNLWQATGFAMDSRAVKKGDLFIALKGEAGTEKYRTSGLDGHDFVRSAYENGAVAAIVDHQVDCEIPQLVVKDTFKALQNLGRFSRGRAPLKQAIAVTGSVGKTGTRDMIKAAFDGCGLRTHASVKSYNNMFGVPYTLACMPRDTEIGVFEAGMNYADEITPLSKQIRPDIAVITWISEQHIENFSNGIKGIVKAKSEIFDGMESHGIAVLPRDNEYYADLAANAKSAGIGRIVTFGEHVEADARLISCEAGEKGNHIRADIMGEKVTYDLQYIGKAHAMNSLAALLTVKLSQDDVVKAAQSLRDNAPLEGRGKRETIVIKGADVPLTLIDDSYNAAPVAVVAALNGLGIMVPKAGGRRIAVLGRMAELGDRALDLHASLADPIISAGVDLVFCCGKDIEALYEKIPANLRGAMTDTSSELAAIVTDTLLPGDVVLVKGSLGSNMKVVVEAIRGMANE